MNEEKPKQYTPEEIAKLEKSRTTSDARLLEEGAEYSFNQEGEKILVATQEQKDSIQNKAKAVFAQRRRDAKESKIKILSVSFFAT